MPSKDVCRSNSMVNKRFRNLGVDSGILRRIRLEHSKSTVSMELVLDRATCNNLLKKKSETLKSLKGITWNGKISSNVPLKNLNQCQNLQEFCGKLNPDDVEILAKLPRLQKLKLENLQNPKYLLDHLKLRSLKYLYLSGACRKTTEIICQELPEHSFPVLERLFIYHPQELTGEFFSFLISNAPKLKSIQLYGSGCPVSHQFMYNFCKSLNIFISFNGNNFEEFLKKKDLVVFQKYNCMKKFFLQWSSKNPEYCEA